MDLTGWLHFSTDTRLAAHADLEWFASPALLSACDDEEARLSCASGAVFSAVLDRRSASLRVSKHIGQVLSFAEHTRHLASAQP